MSSSERSGRKPDILLVEDEESLAEGLRFNLQEEGYSVRRAPDGRRALEMFESAVPDLVLLDIMLPHVDGFEVARHIRDRDPRIPILVLTARTGLNDRITGLQLGADDYIAKPFHLKELLLRVSRMLERARWYGAGERRVHMYEWADIRIDFDRQEGSRGEHEFELTAMEASVLEYFILNRDRIVSRNELLERVWNLSPDTKTRTVDNFVLRLRRHIEPDADNPIYLKSVRGAGYTFSTE